MNAPAAAEGNDDGASFVHSLFIGPDHPALAGHFPGQPILPGVALLAEVVEAARVRPALAACIGPQPRLGAVKFLSAVMPGTALEIVFALEAATLRWHVDAGTRRVASGDFACAPGAGAS